MTGDSTGDPTNSRSRTSRRRFLSGAAAATLVGSSASLLGGETVPTATAQEESQDPVPTFAFGVTVDGWHGVAPEPIAGTLDPTLQLEPGRTYRLVWRNRDGRPHGLALTDGSGIRFDALRVLDVDAEAVSVFDSETAASELAWSDVTNGTRRYLDVTDQPISVSSVSADDFVNASALEGADDATVRALEYSPVVVEQGGIQAVEFKADPEMARYVDVLRPYSADGVLSVGSDQG